MCFLTHQALTPLLRFIEDNRHVAAAALRAWSRPWARDVKRFHMPASSTFACLINSRSTSTLCVFLGICDRRAHRFGDDARGRLGVNLRNVQRFFNALAADLIDHQANFSRGDSDKFCDRACFHNLASLFENYRTPSTPNR